MRTITYRVSFGRNWNKEEYPGDFLHVRGDVIQDQHCLATQPRNAEVWDFTVFDEDAEYLESCLDACKTVSTYRRLKHASNRRSNYFHVSTHGDGWFIESGPFETREEATEADKGCASTDIYDVTAYRNRRILTFNQIKRLRVGIPPRRIGEEGAWSMLNSFYEEKEQARD